MYNDFNYLCKEKKLKYRKGNSFIEMWFCNKEQQL